MKAKNKQGVKNGIDNRAGQHTGHGKFGTSVGPNQRASAGGENQKGEAERGNPRIFQSIIQRIRRCAKEEHQGIQENPHTDTQNDAGGQEQKHRVSHIFSRFPIVLRTHTQIKIGSAADAEQQRQRRTQSGQGERHIGGGVSVNANAVSNKNLVHNVIQSADQHGNYTGNCKLQQQFSDFFFSQTVSHSIPVLSSVT